MGFFNLWRKLLEFFLTFIAQVNLVTLKLNLCKKQKFIKDRGFFSPVPVAKQREYFLKTIAYLQQRRIPCVIANPPMHKNFLAGMKKKTIYQEFQQALAEIASTYKVAVFNAGHDLLLDNLHDEDFLDGDHLCHTGAGKFSASFADHLSTRGFKFTGMKLKDCCEVISQADFLSLHVPLTAATRNMINADVLARMKPGSYLINMARGGVVDEQALYQALVEGKTVHGAAPAIARE